MKEKNKLKKNNKKNKIKLKVVQPQELEVRPLNTPKNIEMKIFSSHSEMAYRLIGH